MASPAQEARFRQEEAERQSRAAPYQTSMGAAYGMGGNEALAGWTRSSVNTKEVGYPVGGAASKRKGS